MISLEAQGLFLIQDLCLPRALVPLCTPGGAEEEAQGAVSMGQPLSITLGQDGTWGWDQGQAGVRWEWALCSQWAEMQRQLDMPCPGRGPSTALKTHPEQIHPPGGHCAGSPRFPKKVIPGPHLCWSWGCQHRAQKAGCNRLR